jgi:peptidylprolyl isomerase
MKPTILILMMAASAALATAQTPSTPAAPVKHTATAAKPGATAATAKHVATTKSSTTAIPLPPGVPPVKAPVATAFSLRYQDIQVGTGAEAEPNKMYKVQYTGWLAADGHKFDSSYDHPRPPVLDKDKKPVLDAEGKPVLGDPQPISFPQGMGRVIPGWDQGFGGMRIGGKRRIFIPWQLAYGAKGRPGPDAAHPGIPAKADLIFDVELVDVADLPVPPSHPGMGGMMGGRPMPGAGATPNPGMGMGAAQPHPAPTAPAAPGTPASKPAPPAASAPATPSAPAAPATAPAPAAPSTPAAPAAPASK